MNTLDDRELRALAAAHMQRQLLADCASRAGRARVRCLCFHAAPFLYWNAYHSVIDAVGTIDAHRRCALAVVHAWLRGGDA